MLRNNTEAGRSTGTPGLGAFTGSNPTQTSGGRGAPCGSEPREQSSILWGSANSAVGGTGRPCGSLKPAKQDRHLTPQLIEV
jgi:hypothetical protein